MRVHAIAVTWRSEYRQLAHVRIFDVTREITEQVARRIGAEIARNGALRVVIAPGATEAAIGRDVLTRIDRAGGG